MTGSAPPGDKAGVGFWQSRYREVPSAPERPWQPEYYEERILERWLSQPLAGGARSLLEVGCGDSRWLPHLAAQWPLERVAGIDYSSVGCSLVSRRLEAAGISARIECADVLSLGPEELGRFDLVYSLGVVEHFDRPGTVIRHLASLLAPGGMLLTEVPNLGRSVHRLGCWIWGPKALATHHPIARRRLHALHEEAGLAEVRSTFLGVFSLMIVTWARPERFPRLAPRLVDLVNRVRERLDPVLERCGSRGTALLAPYIVASGRSSEAPAGP